MSPDPRGNGTVTNEGEIRTFGDFSTGIYHDAGIAQITNDGLIETVGAEANGIAVASDGARVTNGGMISTEGADSGAIAIFGDNAAISNSGTILTTGAGDANGMSLVGSGSITNSGRITTTSPNSWAIIADFGAVDIINSGLIAGSGGIVTRHTDATILNSGAIVLSSDRTGILANGDQTDIVNTGVIRSTAAFATGIFADGNNVTIRNSGQIFMEGGTAVEMDVGLQTLILDAGSIVVGDLVVNNGGFESTVDVRLPNAALSFSGLPEFFETDGRPSLLDGDTLHVFDPAHFAALDRATADVLEGVDLALSGPRQGHGQGYEGWATGYVTGNRSEASAGLVVGGTWHLSADRRVDAFLGTLDHGHESDFSTTEIDTRGLFAGLGYSGEVGRLSFRTAAFVGRADHDSIRRVADNTVSTGISEARAAFSSDVFGLSMTVATETEWRDMTLRPSVRLRYLRQDSDAFAESGSNSDLTVAARTSERLDLRAMLEMDLAPRQTALGQMDLSIFGGLDVVTTSGDRMSAEVVGLPISFAPQDRGTEVGAFIGAAADFTMGDGATLSLHGEIGSGIGDGVSGRLGASYVFRF